MTDTITCGGCGEYKLGSVRQCPKCGWTPEPNATTQAALDAAERGEVTKVDGSLTVALNLLGDKGEDIVAAAILLMNGAILTMQPPARHAHLLIVADKLQGGRIVPYQHQGFLTNRGAFVDRKEAYKIVTASGRDLMRNQYGYNGQELFSEDLW